MVPSFNGGSDVIWICAPGEGFGDFVGFCDESVDSGLEIDEAVANPKTDSSVWRRPLVAPYVRVHPLAIRQLPKDVVSSAVGLHDALIQH